jgi:hypothetical protein
VGFKFSYLVEGKDDVVEGKETTNKSSAFEAVMEKIHTLASNRSKETTKGSKGSKGSMDLNGAFEKFDVNKDGTIEPLEMKAVLQSFDIVLEPAELDVLFGRFDPDKGGSVNYAEFCTTFFNRRTTMKQDAAAAKELRTATTAAARAVPWETKQITPETAMKGLRALGKHDAIRQLRQVVLNHTQSDNGWLGFEEFFNCAYPKLSTAWQNKTNVPGEEGEGVEGGEEWGKVLAKKEDAAAAVFNGRSTVTLQIKNDTNDNNEDQETSQAAIKIQAHARGRALRKQQQQQQQQPQQPNNNNNNVREKNNNTPASVLPPPEEDYLEWLQGQNILRNDHQQKWEQSRQELLLKLTDDAKAGTHSSGSRRRHASLASDYDVMRKNWRLTAAAAELLPPGQKGQKGQKGQMGQMGQKGQKRKTHNEEEEEEQRQKNREYTVVFSDNNFYFNIEERKDGLTLKSIEKDCVGYNQMSKGDLLLRLTPDVPCHHMTQPQLTQWLSTNQTYPLKMTFSLPPGVDYAVRFEQGSERLWETNERNRRNGETPLEEVEEVVTKHHKQYVEGRGFVVVHPLGMVFDEQVQQDPEFEELITRVIVVKAVEANSVAEEQGVKAGMVVEEINGVHVQEEALNTMVAFEAQVRPKRTGS